MIPIMIMMLMIVVRHRWWDGDETMVIRVVMMIGTKTTKDEDEHEHEKGTTRRTTTENRNWQKFLERVTESSLRTKTSCRPSGRMDLLGQERELRDLEEQVGADFWGSRHFEIFMGGMVKSLSKILRNPIRSEMMKLQCAYFTPCFLKLCNCLYSQSVVDLVIWWHHDTLNSHERCWWTCPFTIVGGQNRRFTPFLKVCPKCGMSFSEPLYSGMDDLNPRSLMNGWCLMWMMWMMLRVGHESHVIMGSYVYIKRIYTSWCIVKVFIYAPIQVSILHLWFLYTATRRWTCHKVYGFVSIHGKRIMTILQ